MRILKNFILISIALLGCKTEEPQNPPTVITKVANDVTLKNATLNGEVTEEGFSATTDRGFVFSDKNTNPSVSDTKIQSGYGKGVYSIVLDKLPVNTKYYYKAYATNTKGTAYGEVQSFTTADYKLPTAVTDVPKNITYTTAELGGSVIDEGGGAVSESGFVVGTNASPTITDLKFPLTKGKAAIALIVSKLNVNTKYFVRSYAVNEKGVAYGNEQSFTTADYKLPTVKTNAIVLLAYGATLGGQITDDGGLNISERGVCYSFNNNPTITDSKVNIGNGIGDFYTDAVNLKSSTIYYVRAYAINSRGIAYGDQVQFTTKDVPTVKSKTGKTWMDRNLGASQVATSSSDDKAYGDLYQWGRPADGHENRISRTTTLLSNNDKPLNTTFIISASEEPYDWRNPKNDNLWQGINSMNNVCPVGFRLPTEKEWLDEISTWNNGTLSGAFESPLKLPAAGLRWRYDGSLKFIGQDGYYWSSTIENGYSIALNFFTGNPSTFKAGRANGSSVRCIKD